MTMATMMLKQRWMEWVTSEPGSKYLGPKKCRYVVSWLSGNRMDAEGDKMVKDFMRWMLDDAELDTVNHKGFIMVRCKK